jgi:SAM-dependent methyltransferase
VPENPYDQIAYRTYPRRQTHPDRLAAVATLFGMAPAPVTSCRLLEIGCGDGGNLLPLAYTLPASRFTGIDLAERPVAIAQRIATDLEFTNVDLQVRDLRKLGKRDGEFDYILAHGIYSWVPAGVRDRLLAICAERLAPNGVAFVSYNAYPGQYERKMLREILLRRGDDVESARDFLRMLPHREAAALAACPDDVLFHDILAPVNDPVWFEEFASQAAAHGLRYLGEADPHNMFDETGELQDKAGEQQLDFRKLRRFRQTLLCRKEIALKRRVGPELMDAFLFSANSHGRRIAGEDPAVEAVAQALQDVYPLPVTFAELVPYARSAASLREILFAMLAAGCADIHVYDFPCEESVTERPCASRLARYQAKFGAQVTNLCHLPVQLDEAARRLLPLLDGTRRRKANETLHWMAQMALLEG